jgi:hypothetical protein
MTSASKKPAPSFDVARDPLPRAQAGWVYRSDARPNGEPAPASAASRVMPPAAPPPASAAAPVHDPAPRFQPDAPLPPDRGWLATGLYFIALPMTLGMTLMFAPLSWMLGVRSKR